MPTLKEAASEFLSHDRVAVVGVSRKGDTAANVVYRRMRSEGFTVFAVNPEAEEVEGDRAWPSLEAIPGGVEAVVVGTPPAASAEVVRACGRLGIRRAWLHRSFGGGSWSAEAVAAAREAGVALLEGGCPMMFLEPVDPAHRCFRWLFGAMGRLPDGSEYRLPDGED